MAVIGNAPFQGLVSGGNILDASIEGVDLSTSAIAARLGYTPVDPGAAAFTATLTAKDIQQDNATYIKGKLAAGTATRLFGINASDTIYIGSIDANHTGGTLFVKNGTTQMVLDSNGRLGINEASPARLLHITTTTGPNLRLQTAGSNAAIEFIPSVSSGLYNWVVGAQYNISNAFEITPSTAVNGTTFSTPAFVVTSSGNVGVGATNPTTKLDIGSAQGTGVVMRYDTTTSYKIRMVPYWNSSTDSRLDFDVERSANAGYSTIMSVGYNTNVGIGTVTPAEKLDVNGNIYIHTATGNPYLKIKTDGAGNNPWVRLQADTNYWDIQGTFSQTYDDLMFMYNGTNKMSFSTHSGGGLSIANSGNQLGRLTIDTNGFQHVVRGGGLNSGDYYYRFFKLFKLRTSAGSGSATEVKGRLHLSRVNDIGVSTMVDFFASQGYNSQIRVWYNRVSGPDGGTSFRFSTLSEGGSKYLCLEAYSAPGWTNWQFEGSVVDYDGARGDFSVTASPGNLNWTETGPWNTPISNPGTPLLQDTDFGAYVLGVTNFEHLLAGTKTTVASTHIFGAPQTSGNFGEAMRITSSGKVGIGTSSPGTDTTLDVIGNITIDSAFSSQYGLCFRRGFEASDNLRIYAGDTGVGRIGGLRLTAYDGIAFGTGSNTWQERVRITNEGNLLVGNTVKNSALNAGHVRAKGYSGCETVSVTALNTNYVITGAINGILVVRDDTTGGTDLWLIDPNQGNVKIAGNITKTLVFTYSNGYTYVKQTTGSVTSNYSFVALIPSPA